MQNRLDSNLASVPCYFATFSECSQDILTSRVSPFTGRNQRKLKLFSFFERDRLRQDKKAVQSFAFLHVIFGEVQGCEGFRATISTVHDQVWEKTCFFLKGNQRGQLVFSRTFVKLKKQTIPLTGCFRTNTEVCLPCL